MFRYDYKIMTIESKEVYREYLYCDECGRRIRAIPGSHVMEKSNHEFRFRNVQYYRVTVGHNDWGNDSIDSIRTEHICPDCLQRVFSKYMDRSNGISNTEYIEIEHVIENDLVEEEEVEP